MLRMNNPVITSNVTDNNTIRNHPNVSYLPDCGTAGGRQNPPLPGSPRTTPGTSDCYRNSLQGKRDFADVVKMER